MAGVKVTDLPVLATAAADDVLYIVDTSDNLSKQIAVEDFLGYKVYTALLSQSGVDAPTSIELENTLGTITFGYNNVGNYSVLSDSLFILEKTAIFLSPLNNAGNNAIAVINPAGASEFFLETLDILGASANERLFYTAIEIRVYN